MGVVLLHSGITDARQWDREVAEWPFDVRAPGVGEWVGFTGPAALVGSSFGGRVAMELAVAHPQAVDRLVLVCPGLPGAPMSAELEAVDAREEELVAAGEFEAAAELMVETWVPGAPEPVKTYVRDAQLAAYRADEDGPPRLDPPLAERLHEVRAPTLLVDGELDRPEFRAIVDRLESELPDVRGRVTIPGAYHLPNLERPAAFDAAVLPFLSETD